MITAALQNAWTAMMTQWSHDALLGTASVAYEDQSAARCFDAITRAPLSAVSDDPSHVAWLVEQWKRWLWRRNQFVVIDSNAESALLEQARAVARSPLTAVDWSHHRRALVAVIRSILGDERHAVTSSNYTAGLILRVLSAHGEQLRGPALDIGAGDGRLVSYLRKLGVDAVGFDRLGADVDFSSENRTLVSSGDWLHYPYQQQSWQLITSHHAFSLFFARADRMGQLVAVDYARAYMRILDSLAIGGTFAYYPSLPFIERLLPGHRYLVNHVALPADLTAVADTVDPNPAAFCSHVQRL